MIKKILKKYFNGFVSIQMILAVVFCGIVLVPKLFGYTSFAVLSDSMYPEIKKGYMVFVDTKVDPKDIKVGDILAFYLTPETCATHRVVEKNEEIGSFVTKGDLNATKDVAPVYYNNVIGRTEGKVPLVGYIQIFLMSFMGKIIAFSLIIFDIVIYILIIRDTNKEKQNKKEQENEQKESE